MYHFYDISEHVFDMREFREIVEIILPGKGIFVGIFKSNKTKYFRTNAWINFILDKYVVSKLLLFTINYILTIERQYEETIKFLYISHFAKFPNLTLIYPAHNK